MAFAPLVLAVIIGFAAGLIRRGRLRSILGVRIVSLPLLALAIGIGFATDQFDLPQPGWWAFAGLVAALIFTIRNLMIVGMAVIGVGIIANLVPIVLNGATPVRAEALVEAGMVETGDLDRVVVSGARAIADEDTRLGWLGDTIPIAVADQVVSFGDLIMLIGVANTIANLMLRRRRRHLPSSALASLEAFGWHETEEKLGSVVDIRTELRPLTPPMRAASFGLCEHHRQPRPGLGTTTAATQTLRSSTPQTRSARHHRSFGHEALRRPRSPTGGDPTRCRANRRSAATPAPANSCPGRTSARPDAHREDRTDHRRHPGQRVT